MKQRYLKDGVYSDIQTESAKAINIPDSPAELEHRIAQVEQKLENNLALDQQLLIINNKKMQDLEKLIIRLYKEFGIKLETDTDPNLKT